MPKRQRNQPERNEDVIVNNDDLMSDDPRIDVDVLEILNHRTVQGRVDYLVKYTDGARNRRRWFNVNDLENCEAIIRRYWREKGQSNPHGTPKSTKRGHMDVDESPSAKPNNSVDLTIEIENCDPFAEGVRRYNRRNYYDDDEDSIKMPKTKKAKYEEGDEVAEIENILERQKYNGVNQYLIKWVGSKVPTWISEDDFYQHEMLAEFLQYENARQNKSLQRRAYIYCRTSRRNADREVSLHDQERYCLNFAKRNNINIVGVYYDNGVSAKDMKNQFALNYLCDHIQPGECILFYDVSRFSRSMVQALQRLEHLRKDIGAFAHACHDGLTWNNVATNRASFRQNLSNAQLHSEVISEKVISAIEYKRERGDHIGYVPYGYKTDIVDGVRQLVPNQDERDTIKAILNETFNVVSDRFMNLNIDGKSKKAPRKTSVSRRQILKQGASFTPSEYQTITNTINHQFTNRGGKPFTWRFIKRIILLWGDKL